MNWRLTHIGGGELRDRLRDQADRLGLSDRIEWLGALPQGGVIEHYRNADLFVLASRVGDDGDRDGLPNGLMEAQSQAMAGMATEEAESRERSNEKESGLSGREEEAGKGDTASEEGGTEDGRRQGWGDRGEGGGGGEEACVGGERMIEGGTTAARRWVDPIDNGFGAKGEGWCVSIGPRGLHCCLLLAACCLLPLPSDARRSACGC